ncbi:MAG: alanine racemase [Micropruina sp.]
MAVVKADGYGHGAGTVSRGPAVAAARPGSAPRTSPRRPRCARREPADPGLAPSSGLDVVAAAAASTSPSVHSTRPGRRWCGFPRRGLRIHLNVDVGMARGCPEDDWDALFARALRAQRQGGSGGRADGAPAAGRPGEDPAAVVRRDRDPAGQDAMAAAGLGTRSPTWRPPRAP